MSTLRWRAILYGAAAFLVAHTIERFMWASFFSAGDAVHPAWFLNSGRAALFTALSVAVAGVVVGAMARDRRELFAGAANAAGGGIVAMIVALFVSSPGTIFPLVILIGGALVIAGTFAGALVALALSAKR
jgi:hypothetical protein